MARELQRDELISGKKERIRREANDMVDNRVHCTDCRVRGGDFVKSTQLYSKKQIKAVITDTVVTDDV